MLRKFVDLVTSLKLTIACLAAAMVLIFAGTIAQVDLGIYETQQRFFQSLFVWWPPEGGGLSISIFPGGHLIGAILVVNLIAAHARRFHWAWRKLGIHLTHAGLIIMLAGGLFTDLFAIESRMRLTQGETKNYSEDARRMELAIIDTSDAEFDLVTAIPGAFLQQNRTIEHKSLPFRIVVKSFYQNSRLLRLTETSGTLKPIANQGAGAQVTVESVPRTTKANDRDLVSAAIEIIPVRSLDDGAEASLGTWLVSGALGAPQTFSCAGRTWQLVMRPVRYYKPYSITLQKFMHERYVGTEVPKNFASRITLIDPEQGVNRGVLIYMNHPLRYRGETYYQAGFERDDQTSILQVVRNPSFIAPYVACIVVATGLLVQFGYHLAGFSRRRRAVAA